jgi:hypothetical protein
VGYRRHGRPPSFNRSQSVNRQIVAVLSGSGCFNANGATFLADAAEA